jgi:hypothetical protein
MADRERKKSRVPLILILLVAALAVVLYVPRFKQAMLPSYATPESFEERFPKQLAALRAVAEGTKRKDAVAGLFADPVIEGAIVVNRYTEGGGKAVSSIKRDSRALREALMRGVTFPTDPGVDSAVVNVWGGNMAVYEVQFETAAGELRGYSLAVDLKNLERMAMD